MVWFRRLANLPGLGLLDFWGIRWIFSGWRRWTVLPLVVLIVWWIPWVLVLHSGALLYFPYDEKGQSRFLRATGPLLGTLGADWTPHSDIPQACKRALVASEDALFYVHGGVDWESTGQAWKKALKQTESLPVPFLNKKDPKAKSHSALSKSKSKPLRGGSTITQQLVKNAFLSRSRSYIRKAREITGALILDLVLSKESQLDWYFNVVEFGPRKYGIKSAAQYYFSKEPSKLGTTECAQLVALLPSPIKWGASLKKGVPSSFLAKRTQIIRSRANMLAENKTAKVPSQNPDWQRTEELFEKLDETQTELELKNEADLDLKSETLPNEDVLNNIPPTGETLINLPQEPTPVVQTTEEAPANPPPSDLPSPTPLQK